METYQNNSETVPGLSITEEMRKNLLEIAKWSKFLAIMGYIGMGFMVLAAIIIFFMGSMSRFGGGLAYMSLIYIVIAIIYYFPVSYLNNASNGLKDAMVNNNKIDLEYGIENLKSHYKFMGIFVIVVISIYLIILIFGLLIASLY